jgi:hypothetical protein
MSEAEFNYPYKSYLGDGVYVQVGSYHGELVLTAEDGVSVNHRIVLSECELRALSHYRVFLANILQAKEQKQGVSDE